MNRNQSIRCAVLSAVTFFAGFFFCSWLPNYFYSPFFNTWGPWIPMYFIGGITLVCASLMPSKPFIVAPIAFGGILVGAAFTAFMETSEHNLLPKVMTIMAFGAGFSSLGIIAGTILGSVIHWIRK